MSTELDFDLPYPDFVKAVRGRTNAELREILIEHWNSDLIEYGHGELVEALMDAYRNGVTPVTDYSRAQLVQEVVELHPDYDDVPIVPDES